MADAHHSPSSPSSAPRPSGRLEAFSDGVFSIAITLLAFQLLVPFTVDSVADRGLGQALLDQWPAYLSFIISFLTILIIWINHHNLLNLIQRVDHQLMLLNGLLLLCVSVIPFTDHLLSTYLTSADAPVAAFVYAGWLLLMSFSFQGIWYYARDHDLLNADLDPAIIRRINRVYPLAALIYLIATLMALFSVLISVSITLGLAVFFALPARRARSASN